MVVVEGSHLPVSKCHTRRGNRGAPLPAQPGRETETGTRAHPGPRGAGLYGGPGAAAEPAQARFPGLRELPAFGERGSCSR